MQIWIAPARRYLISSSHLAQQLNCHYISESYHHRVTPNSWLIIHKAVCSDWADSLYVQLLLKWNQREWSWLMLCCVSLLYSIHPFPCTAFSCQGLSNDKPTESLALILPLWIIQQYHFSVSQPPIWNDKACLLVATVLALVLFLLMLVIKAMGLDWFICNSIYLPLTNSWKSDIWIKHRQCFPRTNLEKLLWAVAVSCPQNHTGDVHPYSMMPLP